MFPLKWKGRTGKKPTRNRGRLSLQRASIAIDRLSRFRFFSASDYRALHDDLGMMDPAVHFIGYGGDERRKAAIPTHIARTLGILQAEPLAPYRGRKDAPQVLTIGVFVSSLSDPFLRETSYAIATLMRRAGHQIIMADEKSEIEERPRHCIYVAPHEFFFLGNGPAWVRDDVLIDACMYCTAPAHRSEFWHSLHVVLMGQSVITSSRPVAVAFSEVMPSINVIPSVVRDGTMPSETATLEHPLLSGQRWWEDAERPLDLYFFGSASPHRARFFAKHSDRLSNYDSFIYLKKSTSPNKTGGTHFAGAFPQVAQHIARHSRLLINVHRDEFPYFEWHRIVDQAMINGCVAVSEPCFLTPEFQPGIHYLEEETHRLVALAEWALNDADGRDMMAAIAAAGQAAIRDRRSERASAQMIADVLTT